MCTTARVSYVVRRLWVITSTAYYYYYCIVIVPIHNNNIRGLRIVTTARRYTRTLRDIIIRLFMRTIRSRCIDGEFNDSSLYVLLLLLLSFRTDANGRCHRVFRARVVDKLFWVETKKKKINVRKTAMIIIIYCDWTVTCRVQEDNAPCNCFFHFFSPVAFGMEKKITSITIIHYLSPLLTRTIRAHSLSSLTGRRKF